MQAVKNIGIAVAMIARNIAIVVALTLVIITGVKVLPDWGASLPKTESVSWVEKIETQCPDQKVLPRFNFKSPCVQEVIAKL